MKAWLWAVSGGGLAVAVVTSVAVGQRPANEVGIMAGVNFAKVSGSDLTNPKSRTGLTAGGFARLGVANHVAIEPEVLYSQQGAKGDFDVGVQGTFKLDYIQMPLLLRVMIPTKGTADIHPSLFAGPALGIKSSCKLKATSGSTSIAEDCSDTDAKIKSTDFLVVFGGGLDVRGLTFGLRYALGLSKVDDSTDPSDAKNKVFSFTVGYGFRLKK